MRSLQHWREHDAVDIWNFASRIRHLKRQANLDIKVGRIVLCYEIPSLQDWISSTLYFAKPHVIPHTFLSHLERQKARKGCRVPTTKLLSAVAPATLPIISCTSPVLSLPRISHHRHIQSHTIPFLTACWDWILIAKENYHHTFCRYLRN